jgi:hypothetical protein
MSRIAVDGNYQFDNDLNSVTDAVAGNGVVSGMAVTENDAGADMSVDVASGVYIANGTTVTYAGGNVVITAADGSNPRKDIIIADSSGNITAVAGTPAAAAPVGNTGTQTYAPVPPDITTNKIILSEVWVGTGVTTIINADITDRRITLAGANILDNTAGGTDALTTKGITSNVVYDITHNLSGHLILPWGVYEHMNPLTGASNPYAITIDRTLTFVKWAQFLYVVAPNDGTNYWTISIKRITDTNICNTLTTAAVTAATNTVLTDTSFAIASVGAADLGIYISCTKTNTPGNLYLFCPFLEVSV